MYYESARVKRTNKPGNRFKGYNAILQIKGRRYNAEGKNNISFARTSNRQVGIDT